MMPYKLVEVCQTNSMALAKGADRSIPKPLGELIIECMITGERKRVRDADIRALLFCKRQNNQQEDAVLGVIYEETGIVSGFDITEHNVLKASSNRMRNVVINDNPHMRAMLTKAIRDLFSHGDIKISPENKK
ncbi:MAG: hypothetical protein PHW45_04345 [Candidatus ainarchaeum sp.]|nr:hypothetical protein [Candidatus ainarchaeum sp.]